VGILNITIILIIAGLLLLNLPLFVSIVLVVMYAISIFTKKGPDLKKLKAATVGILSVIVTSSVILILPKGALIDELGTWIIRILCIIPILFAIGDTYVGKTRGVKIIICVSIVIIIFGLIGRMAFIL
jgi:hypothetical protein